MDIGKKVIRIKAKKAELKPENLYIDTDFIKLDSALKLCGIAQTGGHAKIIIAENEVTVNGDICTERGKKLRNGDIFRCGREAFEIVKR